MVNISLSVMWVMVISVIILTLGCYLVIITFTSSHYDKFDFNNVKLRDQKYLYWFLLKNDISFQKAWG